MLDLSRELRLPSPLLAVRVHADTPPELFDRYLDAELLSMGQPTFYGEERCVEAMVRRGLPEAEARRVVMNSCMGLVIAGEEISDMWGGVVNMLLPLEMVLGGGQPLHHELPIGGAECSLHAEDGYRDFESAYGGFARYLEQIVAYCVGENEASARWLAENRPNPFLSALTRDCISRGLDRAAGGARYHCVIIEGFGWCNVADGLTATKRLVFDEGRYTLGELAAAARDNFRDAEELRS